MTIEWPQGKPVVEISRTSVDGYNTDERISVSRNSNTGVHARDINDALFINVISHDGDYDESGDGMITLSIEQARQVRDVIDAVIAEYDALEEDN